MPMPQKNRIPLVKGGQGRTDEEAERQANDCFDLLFYSIILTIIAGLVLLLAA